MYSLSCFMPFPKRNNLAQTIFTRDKEGKVPARAGASASGSQVAQERETEAWAAIPGAGTQSRT